jgi:hypothetical protein
MDFNKLFHLVHFFAADHVDTFGVFMKGKKKQRSWLLYTRILEQAVCNKRTEKSVRGKEFKTSSGYNIYRNRLANLILECLVKSKTDVANSITFIRTTYLWDMEDIGYKVLVPKMHESWENEALTDLQACFDLMEDLKNYHSISIELPETVVSREDFFQIRDNNRHLMRQINRNRAAFKLPDAEKKLEARMNLGSLPPTDVTTLNKTLRLKVLTGIALLNSQYHRSFRLGEALVARIESMPHKFPKIFLAKEIQMLALQAAQLNLRGKAVHYTMRLSLLQAENLYEEAEIRVYSIKVGVFIATQFQSEGLTDMVLNQLKGNQRLFQAGSQRKLFFTLALAFYLDENWSKSISCITSLHSIKASKNNDLSWEPLLVLAICQCEANNPDYAESIFQSSLQQARQSGLEYPIAAIKSIKRFYHAVHAERKVILEKDIAMIRTILLNPDEKRAALTYSAEHLLVSKLTGETIRSIRNAERLVDFASMDRMVDINQ